MTLDDAGLDDLVHEERPVFEAEALGGPRRRCAASIRIAAISSSTSTRRRCRSRPDKEDIYITINITEGPRYTVSAIRLGGDLPIPGPELVPAGAVAGRRNVLARTPAGEREGDQRPPRHGRLCVRQRQRHSGNRPREAAVPRSPSIVDPGRRVYIRKININGNAQTRDEVIRREMRQLEAAWYDGARIERSKVRIRRLGYLRATSTSRRLRSPGVPDQADVEVTVTEKATGNLLAGHRVLERREVRVQRVGVAAEHLRQRQRADGGGSTRAPSIARSRSRSPSRTTRWTAFRARWRPTSAIPIPSSLSVVAVQSSTCGGGGQLRHPDQRDRHDQPRAPIREHQLSLFAEQPALLLSCTSRNSVAITNSVIVSAGWARDTRDDILYPTRGVLQVAGVEVGLPIVDLAYYKANYLVQWFWPVYGEYVADVAWRRGLRRRVQRQAVAVLQGVLRRAAWVRCAATKRPPSARATSAGNRPRRQAQDHRQRGSFSIPILKGDKSVRASVFFDAGQISGVPAWTPPAPAWKDQ